jgi:hypothetical protein
MHWARRKSSPSRPREFVADHNLAPLQDIFERGLDQSPVTDTAGALMEALPNAMQDHVAGIESDTPPNLRLAGLGREADEQRMSRKGQEADARQIFTNAHYPQSPKAASDQMGVESRGRWERQLYARRVEFRSILIGVREVA